MLRTFEKYFDEYGITGAGQTPAQLAKATIYGVASVKFLHAQLNLVDLTGFCPNAAATDYLQVYDIAAASPAGTDVPIISLNLQAAPQLPSLFESFGTIATNNGLFIGISTSSNSWAASSHTASFFGTVEDFENRPGEIEGTTVVGDLATVVNTGVQLVWAQNGTSPGQGHYLREARVYNPGGTVAFLMVIANFPANANQFALWTSQPIAAGAYATFRFGSQGFAPYSVGGQYHLVASGGTLTNLPNGGQYLAPPYVEQFPGTTIATVAGQGYSFDNACQLLLSSTSNVFTAITTGSIQARYV